MRPRFPFGRKKDDDMTTASMIDSDHDDNDPTGWMIHSNFAEILLLHTVYIKYMILFGYTYYNGCKLYKTMAPNTSMLYQYFSMILQNTGGGILAPLLLNGIPVPIGIDSYIIVISISFLLHYYYPILRDVTYQSSIVYMTIIVCYEIMRTYVIIKFIKMAHQTIPPSEFSIPIFGPIICGILAGTGSMFIPFNKGLDYIKSIPIPAPMISACITSILYHSIVHIQILPPFLSSFLQPHLSKKMHVLLSIFMIAYHLAYDYHPIKSLPKGNSSSTYTNGKTTTTTGVDVPALVSDVKKTK